MDFREFFYLQKTDRKAIAFLLCLAIGILGIMLLLGNKHSSTLLNGADSAAIATEKEGIRPGTSLVRSSTEWRTNEK